MTRTVLTTLALLAVAACGPTDDARERPDESAGEGRDLVYVDVRSPDEFASGHVRGAINIPHTEMVERWGELEVHRDDSLVVYCRTGRRSAMAMDVLERQGFDHMRNGGGLDDLRREGVPAE